MNPDQLEKVKACTSREEFLKVAQEENLELSIEDLDGAAGGYIEEPWGDGDEREGIDSVNAHEVFKRGEINYADLDS
jgi:hypothetical protein